MLPKTGSDSPVAPRPLKRSFVEHPRLRPFFTQGLPRRVFDFFAEDVWHVDLGRLEPFRRALYRTARLVFLTGRGFVGDRCLFRAAALTYNTVLSLVPLLAFGFSILKGLGAYATFQTRLKEEYLDEMLPSGDLRAMADQILATVEATDVGKLGVLGLLVAAWAVLRLLNTIERSFNEIWGVQRHRTPVRKLTDYLSLVVVAPIFLVIAVGATSAAKSNSVIEFLNNQLPMQWLTALLFSLMPLVIGWIAFTFVFMALPNTRTQFSSAAIGGFVAALLWQLALWIHVQFQVGVANYNAVYASFAALPVFLVWVQVSWVIVLFGAELAFAHQNEAAYRRVAGFRSHGHAVKEVVAVRVMTRICAAFLHGREPREADGLARELELPPQPVDEALDGLRDAGLLAAVGEGERRFLPARDPGTISLKHVLDALKGRGDRPGLAARGPADRTVDRWLASLEEELEGSVHNRTFRELALNHPLEEPTESGEETEGLGETSVQPS